MPDNYDPAEMMRRAKAALHVSAPSDSLHQIVSRDPEAFLHIRLLYATDNGNAIEVPLPKNDPEIAVTGIFCGPRFLVYSEAAEQGMRQGTYYYRVKARVPPSGEPAGSGTRGKPVPVPKGGRREILRRNR